MDHNMSLQGASLGKCLITFLTLMRFLPNVDTNVFLQVKKCLITLLTFMRFISSMDPNMNLQVANM